MSILMMGLFLFGGDGLRVPLEGDDFILNPNWDHLAVAQDGRILVADWKAGSIRVFSPDGKYAYAIGRKGEGPGEIKRWFGTFSIGADGLVYQVDFFGGNKWINVFDLEGKLVRTLPLKLYTGSYGPHTIYVPHADKLILAVSHNWKTEQKGQLYFGSSQESCWFFKGPTERSILFQTEILHEISERPDGEGRPIPGQASVVTAMSPDGQILAHMLSNQSQLTLLDLATGQSHRLAHGFSKRPLTKEYIRDFLARRFERVTQQRWQAYERSLYDKMMEFNQQETFYLPMVTRLLFSPEGVLLVAGYDEWRKSFDVQCFTKDLRQGPRFRHASFPSAITQTQLYFLEYDEEEDVTTLVITPRSEHF